LVQSLWKSVWKFFKNLKKHLPYDLPIPFLYIYLKELKSVYDKDPCAPMFITALHNSQAMESAYVPINWWMDRENVTST
jgi:hypothetical protein